MDGRSERTPLRFGKITNSKFFIGICNCDCTVYNVNISTNKWFCDIYFTFTKVYFARLLEIDAPRSLSPLYINTLQRIILEQENCKISKKLENYNI